MAFGRKGIFLGYVAPYYTMKKCAETNQSRNHRNKTFDTNCQASVKALSVVSAYLRSIASQMVWE